MSCKLVNAIVVTVQNGLTAAGSLTAGVDSRVFRELFLEQVSEQLEVVVVGELELANFFVAEGVFGVGFLGLGGGSLGLATPSSTQKWRST